MVDCGSPVLLRSRPSVCGTWIISVCRFGLHSSDINWKEAVYLCCFVNPQSVSSLGEVKMWVIVIRVTDWISNGNMYGISMDFDMVDHQKARGIRRGGISCWSNLHL
jgi:hypothetical protein